MDTTIETPLPEESRIVHDAGEHSDRMIRSVYVSAAGATILVVYLLSLSFLLLYSITRLWPVSPTSGDASLIRLFAWTFSVSNEVRLLLLVMLTGALGSLVHALRSVYWYIGNRALVRSWLPMYIMLPFTGTTLALLFYLVIRGGFFAPGATAQDTSPFGFAAIAGLIGMFSQQAVLKLKEVAETVLAKPAPGEDAAPQNDDRFP
jgi:hypothetical protein